MLVVSHKVQNYIGKYFTNYNLAYVGDHFSNAFLEWVNSFLTDIQNAFSVSQVKYIGTTCSLKANYYLTSDGVKVMCIESVSMNPIVLTHVYIESHMERMHQGLTSAPPLLSASTKHARDYTYYSDGGTYYGHNIDIVKRKGSSNKKPRFNYYDKNTMAIMFVCDFFSPFPFNGKEAEAWATDGHKYKLPSMIFLENKHNIDTIITETIHNFLRREFIS